MRNITSPEALAEAGCISQSPRDILSQIFQIQGVALDPDDMEYGVDKIVSVSKTRPKTARSSAKEYDYFISYRVDADKQTAEKLYLYLKAQGLNPFLDKKCLKNGEPWKQGFISGLMKSKKVIALISNKSLAPCKARSRDHSRDNVLLELEIALQIKNSLGDDGFIVPVLVGENIGNSLVKFNGFDVSQYSDTIQSQEGAMKPWWVSPPRSEDGQRIAFFTKEFTENVLNGKWYPSRDPPDAIYGEALKKEGGSYSWDLRNENLDRMFQGRY
ncbi:hypothetical protein HDV05_006238 [Chytridiales sp. JEL 0842]|nr:hypothetical protein HDV05_006238 [Chytridiales sp. JEL 0842]